MKPIRLESDNYHCNIHMTVDQINDQHISKYLIHVQQIGFITSVVFGFETYEEYLDYCYRINIEPITEEEFGE